MSGSRLSLCLVCAALLGSCTSRLAAESPAVRGFVTAVRTDGTFDINAARVELAPGATFSRKTDKDDASLAAMPAPWLGESFECFGKLDRKRNTLTIKHLTELVPAPTTFASGGLIEAVLPQAEKQAVTVRADGYLLELPGVSGLHFEDGITAPAVNLWIAYKGTRTPEGTVTVSEATLWRNTPEEGEAKLRDRQTFNPEQVDTAHPQGLLSKGFAGVDPKRLPPHVDPVLQARVEAIGQSLVPSWERTLDAKDPGRIEFRFPVVDSKELRYPVALSSGIVVVPFSVLERLGIGAQPVADARLAAILAVSIAEVLEKQDFLNRDKHHMYETAALLSSAAMASPIGLLALPLGLSGQMSATGANEHLQSREVDQSGRVSLWLLHDAGYDLEQAPLAWWSLWSKDAKPLEQVSLSPQTRNLYRQLGTTWHKAESPQP